MGNHDSVIPCNWKKFRKECVGEAVRFFQHPKLNKDAAEEIWMMALCSECAKALHEWEGSIEISKEEYLTYKVMMM
jgi:hypothetical protein